MRKHSFLFITCGLQKKIFTYFWERVVVCDKKGKITLVFLWLWFDWTLVLPGCCDKNTKRNGECRLGSFVWTATSTFYTIRIYFWATNFGYTFFNTANVIRLHEYFCRVNWVELATFLICVWTRLTLLGPFLYLYLPCQPTRWLETLSHLESLKVKAKRWPAKSRKLT